MGLFKSKTEKWASIVMPSSNGQVPETLLKEATRVYIEQHARILDESIKLFLTSKNKETRKNRYKLACEHYGALSRVKKYADRNQRKLIDKKIDDFVKADDLYRHPDRKEAIAAIEAKQKKKDDFWETYALLEMIEIFSEDWD